MDGNYCGIEKMALPKDVIFGNEALKSDIAHDGIDRFFHGHRKPQNPYQSDYVNYYPATIPVQPIQPYGM